MGIPSIGAIRIGGPAGGAGLVVDARPLPGAAEGQQRVALRLRSPQTTADGVGQAATGSARPGDTVSGLRAELADAVRARDAARPGVARTPDRLSPEERAAVEALRQRDAQVRQEETAHAGTAGSLAGPIAYVYQRGPDGRQYAVGGSVPISAQTVTGDPDEARRIGGRIAAAALAATNPSAADLSAAARAYRFAQPDTAEFLAETPIADRPGAALDRNA